MQIVFFDPFYGTSPMDTSRHTVHTLHLWQMPTYQIPHTLDHKASRGNKQNKYEINSKMRGGSVVLFHSFHSFSLSYSFVLWFISLHVLPLPVPDIHTPPLSESGGRDIPISMVHHADLTEGTTRRRTPGTQRKMSCQETKWSSSSSNVSISMTSLFWRKERQKNYIICSTSTWWVNSTKTVFQEPSDFWNIWPFFWKDPFVPYLKIPLKLHLKT